MEHRSLIWGLDFDDDGPMAYPVWRRSCHQILSKCGRNWTVYTLLLCTSVQWWIGIACIGFITGTRGATTPCRAVKHYLSPQVTRIDCYHLQITTSSKSSPSTLAWSIWFLRKGRICHEAKLIVIRCSSSPKYTCAADADALNSK